MTKPIIGNNIGPLVWPKTGKGVGNFSFAWNFPHCFLKFDCCRRKFQNFRRARIIHLRSHFDGNSKTDHNQNAKMSCFGHHCLTFMEMKKLHFMDI
jgi:hypothetical protein